MIDWEKLKNYENAKWKSFEEFCYQIAKRQFNDLGKFTPIDDSGGGDGVEFYLTLPNGEEWGWQAKFYYPHPRLNISNRKASINNSLKKSIELHPNLKKWFLCTPTNFTIQENTWFKSLKKLAPNQELIHWGKGEFNDFLSKPKFTGIKSYFFGDLELDIDWFSSQVKKQIFNVKEKFIALLHTETDVDFNVHCLLVDSKFIKFIKENLNKMKYELNNFLENKREFEKIYSNPIPADLQTKILKALNNLDECQKEIIPHIENFLTLIEDGFIEKALDFELKNDGKRREEIHNLRDYSDLIYKLFRELPKEQKDSILYIWDKLKEVLICSAEFESVFSNVEGAIDYFKKSELNIFGEALIGKTHIACYICEERVNDNLPAILLLGRDFTKDKNIEKKILEILDIPAQYSWSEFISALESMAEAYRTRIPIVIDALNESETIDIWKNQLTGFIKSLEKNPRIILINTCRTYYIDSIWEAKKPQNYIYIYGFNESNLEEAANKYFRYYKIKADLTLVPLNQFKYPIYLRLFCEINNPERKEEKQVYIGEQTLFKIIEEYLDKCNEKISCKLSRLPNLNIVQDILKKLAKALWINKSRYINYSDAIQLIDEKTQYELDWDNSFTRALLDEGLLISRNMFNRKEKVGFIYDLLGGYLIAKYLLEKQSIKTIESLVKSKEFEENLLGDDRAKLHPLSEDILRGVCVLLPEKFDKHLYELTENNRALSFSIDSLFEIDPKLIDENSVELLIELFGIPENRRNLLRLFRNTAIHVDHPLNAFFLDKLLQNLPMAERDFSWTEFVRGNSSEFKVEIKKFEKICKITKSFNEILRQRLYLTAQYFSWFLASTNKKVRYIATRALYWFGRKYPEKLFELTEKSLSINDPYISERMLAASYGVAMALHYDLNNLEFRKRILPKYVNNLYKLMFKKKALCSTTHILMRDYARHTIEIALLNNNTILKEDQKKRIKPPFNDGGIRKWGREKDRNEHKYRDGNYPFGFDFDNYTIGRLMPNRGNYDFENPEYIKVKSNMWWRIYNLGYSLEQFGEIDKVIARYNYTFGRSDNGGKIDRYGKKYCWIAFYEIAGYRKDKGLLKDKWTEPEERISDTDIDPSFPEKPKGLQVVEKDYLEGGPKDLAEWIEKGPIPDVSEYLNINKIGNIAGPWVLLNGFISQENYVTKRGIFIFLRGFFINEKDIKKFNKYREKIAVEGRRLPESEENYYTFEGEIPWCETFPYTKYPSEIEIPTGKKIHKKVPIDKSVKPIFLKIGDEVTKISGYSEEELKKGYSEFDEEVVKEFDVEIPIRSFHYVVNEGQSVYVLSKEISTELGLHIEPQYFNMLDNKCKKASIVLQLGDSWHNGKDLIYMRKDLLKKYLKKKNIQLLWIVWGERNFKSKHNEGLKEFSEKHKHYKVYGPHFSIFKL